LLFILDVLLLSSGGRAVTFVFFPFSLGNYVSEESCFIRCSAAKLGSVLYSIGSIRYASCSIVLCFVLRKLKKSEMGDFPHLMMLCHVLINSALPFYAS
jgi:hypothetical protein